MIVETKISLDIKTLLDQDNTDVEQALATQTFADGLAKVIADAIKSATVIIQPGAINTIVTVPTGSGTGVNVVPAQGELQ